MKMRLRRGARPARRGVALVTVAILMVGMGMLSLALLSISSSAAKARQTSHEETQALYVAEAGVADALQSLNSGGTGDLGYDENGISLGSSNYYVSTTENADGTLTIVSTGIEDNAGARIQLVVEPATEAFFRWGAFADEWLHLDAQAKVDSYDSGLGTYADQAVNGSGSGTYANANGSTGSNGDITLDQNSKIFGDSMPGTDGTISILGNATVSGATAPLPVTIEFPEIEVPVIASSGPLDVAKNKTASIGPGDLNFTLLKAGTGSTVHVYGPANVVLGSFWLQSGASVIVHAENGPVKFYVEGDFVLNSNTTVASTTYAPADVSFELLSDNIINVEDEVDMDNLDFDSNSKLYGTVYAPNALINIDSNFELFGALMALQLDLDSNCRVHYDEALLGKGDGGGGGYRVICWQQLPYRHDGKGKYDGGDNQ